MDQAGVAAQHDAHTRRHEPPAVGLALVAQRIEAGRERDGRQRPGEVGGERPRRPWVARRTAVRQVEERNRLGVCALTMRTRLA